MGKFNFYRTLHGFWKKNVFFYDEKMHKELIRQHTLTSKYTFSNTEPSFLGNWIYIDCPAGIDLAGGWSDTPPD